MYLFLRCAGITDLRRRVAQHMLGHVVQNGGGIELPFRMKYSCSLLVDRCIHVVCSIIEMRDMHYFLFALLGWIDKCTPLQNSPYANGVFGIQIRRRYDRVEQPRVRTTRITAGGRRKLL